VALLGLMACI